MARKRSSAKKQTKKSLSTDLDFNEKNVYSKKFTGALAYELSHDVHNGVEVYTSLRCFFPIHSPFTVGPILGQRRGPPALFSLL